MSCPRCRSEVLIKLGYCGGDMRQMVSPLISENICSILKQMTEATGRKGSGGLFMSTCVGTAGVKTEWKEHTSYSAGPFLAVLSCTHTPRQYTHTHTCCTSTCFTALLTASQTECVRPSTSSAGRKTDAPQPHGEKLDASIIISSEGSALFHTLTTVCVCVCVCVQYECTLINDLYRWLFHQCSRNLALVILHTCGLTIKYLIFKNVWIVKLIPT